MLTRRRFLSVAAAGTAMVARVPRAAAQARYDLIVRGGRVIDPSARLDAIRDVAISAGRIAAIDAGITRDATETIDARGKLVVPGLLDIHTHVARSADGPSLVLQDGVTGWIDAGTQGADHIADTIAIARSAPQLGRVLINIGRSGLLPEGDTMDLARADVGAAREAIAKNRDFIVGVKARLSRDVAGANDYEVLRRAQEVASSFGLPVMIHMGQTMSPLPKLFELLKRGDIVTHMFAPPPNSIVDDSGRILPAVLAARQRGVWFDVGNGQTGHIRWDTVDAIMKAHFWPDTFSTDWNTNSRQTGVVDLPNCMSKLLGYGMSVPQAVAGVTANAARVFPVFRDRGTLKVGASADVAVLELREGNFEFLDNFKGTITGRQRFFPSATVCAGKRISRLAIASILGAAISACGGSNTASGPTRLGTTMSFFVTSARSTTGNLGGLRGADDRCQTLAVAAGVGDKTWRAYLSVERDPTRENRPTDARSRIGLGPWFNANGVRVASSLAELHARRGDPAVFIDEKGQRINGQWPGSPSPVEHDIMTGSNADGTLLPGFTCDDWTSSSTAAFGQVGHADGLGPNGDTSGSLSSWNSAHSNQNCSNTAPRGGAGRIYCFATD
jgi:dihydroorotase